MVAYPNYIVGTKIPQKENINGNFSKKPPHKIEVYRQPQMRPPSNKNGEQFFPSINKKLPSINNPSINGSINNSKPAWGANQPTQKQVRRRTGSGFNKQRTPLERFNDIPDTDSCMSKNTALARNGANLSAKKGFTSMKDITDKPSNLMMNEDGTRMVFKERKLNRMDKELTDKLTNNRGNIQY